MLYLLISIQDKLTEDLGGVGAGSPGQCPLDNVSDTRSSGQPEEAPLSAGARTAAGAGGSGAYYVSVYRSLPYLHILTGVSDSF